MSHSFDVDAWLGEFTESTTQEQKEALIRLNDDLASIYDGTDLDDEAMEAFNAGAVIILGGNSQNRTGHTTMFKHLVFFQGNDGYDMAELRDTLGTEDFLRSPEVSLYLEQDWDNLETVETLGEGTRDFVEYVNLDGLLYVVVYNNSLGYLGISAVVED